ncbi:MAG: T9SS type A sorting domain-containing protein [Prevotellaceae bacterium]|nr:T9SS type A sorting domain-containing protein [Prevotellaceae bacterium]
MQKLLTFFLLLLSAACLGQEWEVLVATPDRDLYPMGGTINEQGQATFAAYSIGDIASVLSINNEGVHFEQIFGIEGEKTGFLDVKYLDDDTMIVLGYSIDTVLNVHQIRIVTMNKDLEVLSDHRYPVDQECYIHEPHGRLLVDNDGTVIATVPVVWDESVYSHPTIASFWRFNRNGELLNSHYTKSISDAFFRLIVYDMRKLDDDSSFVAIGDGWISNPSIMFFDYDFNMTDYSNIVFEQNEFSFDIDSYYSGYQFDNQHLFVAGSQSVHDINKPHLLMTKVDLEGNIVQRLMIDQPDTLYYGINSPMVSAANDSTIYVTSACCVGNWAAPHFGQLYLINRDMELLGSIVLSDLIGAWPHVVLHTDDGGCIIVGRKYKDYMYVRKYSREDFNPIPCSVKEVPSSQIEALAFPNPASDEINIDISQIHEDGERRIRVVNMSGQVFIDRIIRGEGNVLTLGIEALAQGMYLYQIYDSEKELLTGRFIKD